jgi:hypothetical protein
MSYSKSQLNDVTNFKLKDTIGVLGDALVRQLEQSALATSSFEARDTNLDYPLVVAEKANAMRLSRKVLTVGPKGVVLSSAPEPRMVCAEGDKIDLWTHSLGVVTTPFEMHQLLSWDSPRVTIHSTQLKHKQLEGAVWGYDRNPNSPTYQQELIPPADDVLKIVFERYKLPRVGIIDANIVSVSNGTTLGNADYISADRGGGAVNGYPEIPDRAPGIGEVWIFVAASFVGSGSTRNAWYLRVRVDRSHLAWQSLDLLLFSHSYYSSWMLNHIPFDSSNNVMRRCYADMAWKDVHNVVSALNSTVDNSFMPVNSGKRALSGGFTRQGVSIHDVWIYGWPEFSYLVGARGDTTWDDGSRTLSIGSGIRQLEWFGSRLRDIATDNDEATALTAAEQDGIEEISNTRIKSSLLNKQLTVSNNPLAKTLLYRDANKAGEDISGEVIIEADASRDLPAVTLAQANSTAKGKVYNNLHILDKFGMVNDENAEIVFSSLSTGYSVQLKINGSVIQYESYDDLWRYVWAGAKVIEKGDGSVSFLNWLTSVSELNASDVEFLDEHGDGEVNDWNETTIWPRWIDPSDIPDHTLAAQEIMQFARDRSQLSHFLVAAISQGKLAAKYFVE